MNRNKGLITKNILATIVVALLSFFVFPSILCNQVAYAGIPAKKHVLVLNSYHEGLSWTDNIIKGIDSVLKSESAGRDIELYFEYMDTKRYFGERYFQKLYKAYAEKYRKTRFDVVIVTDNDAFDFARKHYRELFSGVPIVFCGVNDYSDSMVEGYDRITGVAEDTDVKSTIEIALKLHPDTSQFVVVGDKTTTGIAMKNQVLEVVPYFSDRVRFVFLDDFDIQELLSKVREVPPRSIILLTVVNRDKKGNFFPYEESLDLIYRSSKVPIYSFWDFYIGRGIEGGMLTSGFQQGKSSAQMALRILNGEKVSAIPIMKKSPNLYMFDYRELKRFGSRQKNLPAESIIINRPDTVYARYKTFILASSAIIFTLILIIVALLVNTALRRKYEKALRISEEKYRDLYNNAPDMYHSINRDGIVIDCNETEAKMLGYRKEDIIGSPIAYFLTEESRKIYEQEFSVLKDHEAMYGLEREFIRKDGTTFTASLNVFIELDEYGELLRTKTMGRDITESKKVEEELRRSREELRNLSAHIQSAREEERGHIAREIHDELGQILSRLKLDLSWLKKRLSQGQEQLIEKTEKMSGLVDTTITAVQRISSELRPGALDYLGLSAAIEWQVNEFMEQTGIECSAAISNDISVEDKSISTAVFRIVQETLTNVIRHSKATCVNVDLAKKDNALVLEVRDNGTGIDAEKVSSRSSFGLIGMRERARFLGGEINILGVPGKGTTVRVSIPLGHTEN
jgi:PAS domain S-box-containing protein